MLDNGFYERILDFAVVQVTARHGSSAASFGDWFQIET